MFRYAVVPFVALAIACESSPMDPFPDIQAEALGTDFMVADVVEVPVSVTNASNDATYYVWMGPGGICASVDQLGPFGWVPKGNGACYPASSVALAPGSRIDSQVPFYSDRVGTFRIRIHVSDGPEQSGFSAGGEPVEPTGAFRVYSEK
jgi:hypothetical protein